jgi:hypothetical protein
VCQHAHEGMQEPCVVNPMETDLDKWSSDRSVENMIEYYRASLLESEDGAFLYTRKSVLQAILRAPETPL